MGEAATLPAGYSFRSLHADNLNSDGTFDVLGGRQNNISVWLNAPYRLQRGDSWVVTKQLPGGRDVGPVVLKPVV